jgi:hypothetical protein
MTPNPLLTWILDHNKTPDSFFIELHSSLCGAYKRAFTLVMDEEYDLEFEPWIMGTTRHHQVNKVVKREMQRAGYLATIQPMEKGAYSFIEIGYSALRLTVAKGDEHSLPESDYRKQLRYQNTVLELSDPFDAPAIMNCELIHGSKRDDPASIEFARIWFEAANGANYHFDFLKLVDEIHSKVIIPAYPGSGSQEESKSRKPEPEIRIRKPLDDEEQGE